MNSQFPSSGWFRLDQRFRSDGIEIGAKLGREEISNVKIEYTSVQVLSHPNPPSPHESQIPISYGRNQPVLMRFGFSVYQVEFRDGQILGRVALTS